MRSKITKAQRDARKAFRQLDAEKAMTEYEIAQRAFSANRERLKAERLAREATGCPMGNTRGGEPVLRDGPAMTQRGPWNRFEYLAPMSAGMFGQ
jgi:hypothetical protein